MKLRIENAKEKQKTRVFTLIYILVTVFIFIGVYFAAHYILGNSNITVLWQKSVYTSGSNDIGPSSVGFSVQAKATVRKHIINLLPNVLTFSPFPLIFVPIAEYWNRLEKNLLIKMWAFLGYFFALLLLFGNMIHIGFLYMVEWLILPLIFLAGVTPLILLGVIYGKRQAEKKFKEERKDE